MTHSRTLSVAAIVLAATLPVLAGSPGVGEAPPEIGSANWIMNPPEETSLEALRGDVVFIDFWGVKCGPCLALIPHIQKLHEEYGEKGLHIFAFEAQGHDEKTSRETAKKHGARTYPIATGGAGGYSTGGGIPHGWLIGVDGKVVWEGNPGDGKFNQALKAEMAKVKHPGLGRAGFEKALSAALAKYAKRDYAGTRAEAQKMLEGGRLSEAASEEAKHIVARIGVIAARKAARAKALEESKRYAEAAEVYTLLAQGWKGAEEGDAAALRLKEMKADAAIQKEIQAAQALKALLASLERRPAEERKAALEGFAKSKKFEGTQAASDAQAMLE